MSYTYKVGDRVLVNELDTDGNIIEGNLINEIGTICEVGRDDDYPYEIIFDKGFYCSAFYKDGRSSVLFADNELQNLHVKNTAVARAFYKNRIEKIEDGLIYLT